MVSQNRPIPQSSISQGHVVHESGMSWHISRYTALCSVYTALSHLSLLYRGTTTRGFPSLKIMTISEISTYQSVCLPPARPGREWTDFHTIQRFHTEQTTTHLIMRVIPTRVLHAFRRIGHYHPHLRLHLRPRAPKTIDNPSLRPPDFHHYRTWIIRIDAHQCHIVELRPPSSPAGPLPRHILLYQQKIAAC